jgi:hypothetical protein
MPTGRIIDGKAYPPADAPAEVQQAIWAGNEIVGKPYKYGGGHARVVDSGYDCSGTVSYALLGGELLDAIHAGLRARGRNSRGVLFDHPIERLAAPRAPELALFVGDEVDEPHTRGVLDLELDELGGSLADRAVLFDHLATGDGFRSRLTREEEPHAA